jgi:hypothetical protein
MLLLFVVPLRSSMIELCERMQLGRKQHEAVPCGQQAQSEMQVSKTSL